MHHYSGYFRNWPLPFPFFGFLGFGIMGLLFAGVAALLFGVVLMLLWNWLMPVIFSLPAISFWQAWGLVVLSHIFFKSSPHSFTHRHDDSWKHKFSERFRRYGASHFDQDEEEA